ncbi:Fur family transcriptional regulator [Treponema sp.]|uniref:Fur family transcriptional regulator n=1 Tax=Treponema sp. TaxID=166 RepID=UPI00298EB0B1|nr:Fur family transcriptional regulator [Treponema sp.]MCI7398319.1 transcriptional repressor [Spirochaetia bacterium]
MITQLTKQEIADRLESRKIRPSLQRMAVYDFLLKNPVHPSADDIYSSLSPSIPTLSKTTVYNTLKQFADAGLVTTITIEDGELRFDADTSDHIHFKCTECGKIFDIYENIEIDNDILPKGFRLTKSQMNLWGTCRECQPNR